jgi:hypothetical protein
MATRRPLMSAPIRSARCLWPRKRRSVSQNCGPVQGRGLRDRESARRRNGSVRGGALRNPCRGRGLRARARRPDRAARRDPRRLRAREPGRAWTRSRGSRRCSASTVPTRRWRGSTGPVSWASRRSISSCSSRRACGSAASRTAPSTSRCSRSGSSMPNTSPPLVPIRPGLRPRPSPRRTAWSTGARWR